MADQFFGITDTGKQRSNNEDTFIAQWAAKNDMIIACVIDGVGGYSGGEVAAALARESFLNRINKAASGDVIPMLIESFNLANERILKDKQQADERRNMACVATLAMVDIEKNQFYYAHVGDTRLYLLRDQSLVKITQDHSFVGYLEDSQRLTEEAAMAHPKRNEINKALGFESDLASKTDYIETGQSPFLPGDMLLLCSDGLTDMVNKQDITDILTASMPLKEKCKLLVNAANQNGGRDNITAVLVQNDKASSQHEATMPSSSSKSKGEEAISSKEPDEVPMNFKRKTSVAIPVLTILMIVFLGSTVWFYLQGQKPRVIVEQTKVDSLIKKQRNAQEVKLQQAIDQLKGHILLLDTSYKSPIVISEAINISKDSLLIKAKREMVLQSDSAYTGPIFILSAKAKSLQLDSVAFRDCQTAVASRNQTVGLKNVRFYNCKTAVQNYIEVPEKKYINGKIMPLTLKADSLPVKIN
ncbi:PP2C family protein-serine/threonine phosphatase [Mucilaginibacter agri]|uniref:SpoIIE family protein phosphatase n=1 Tax=Mucilaginibacter agri TaxID=2695265 RepID=A0A965ZJP9_9SPHI|nr:protein phosphatase 2C domain-containing protein [Mucilaginibacter agri]NCD72423.1 SpoIIE family protein phosphatase [Mucilaginibacter agri]